MSKPPQNNSTIPLPVLHAQAALKILRTENTDLAAQIEKILPAYALRLEKSGTTPTIENLLKMARQGPESLKETPQPASSGQDALSAAHKQLYQPRDRYRNNPIQIQLYAALITGDLDRAKYCCAHGADLFAAGPEALMRAVARKGFFEIVEFLYKQDTISSNILNAGICGAAEDGHLNIVQYLHKNGADIRNQYDLPLRLAAQNGWFNIVDYLCAHGGDKRYLDEDQHRAWKNYEALNQQWQKRLHMAPPLGLHTQNPRYFKKSAFEAILPLLFEEGYHGAVAHALAFQAAGLFQSTARILQYLQQHGKKGIQPLHDLIYMIKLPKEDAENLKDWGDAVLKCGPGMARFVKFADKLPSPVKSTDGRTWSTIHTRNACARFSFNNAAEHPMLAGLCMEYGIDENDFNTALALVKKGPPAHKNIPDITIAGEIFDMPGAKFFRLPPDDFRGLFLGEITHCCQSIGAAGHNCAQHGYESEDGGFYVIENSRGKIIAQSWAWRGEENELCFDTLEMLGDTIQPPQWEKLLKNAAKSLAKNNEHNVSALTVGLGGDTPAALRKAFVLAARPAIPKNYSGYTEAEKQILVWEKETCEQLRKPLVKKGL